MRYLGGAKVSVLYSPRLGVCETKFSDWIYHPIGKFCFCFSEISLIFYVHNTLKNKRRFLKWQRKNKQ